MNKEPLFYIRQANQTVAGPYDIVQMAGLLNKKIISGETMTRREGDDEWKPFAWHPQFGIAREIPPDADSARVSRLNEEAIEAQQGPIPLPSRETILKLGGLACGALLAGVAAFVLAWLDETTGYILVVAGIGAAILGQCLTLADLLDEDKWTLASVFFVPGGNIYYFLSNFWKYYVWFSVRCIGTAVALGAILGLAVRSAH